MPFKNPEDRRRWAANYRQNDERRRIARDVSRRWRKENPGRTEAQNLYRDALRLDEAYRREQHHKCRYKEPLENKVARLEAQGYKCANTACLKSLDISSGSQDHNHDSGENRGVLCKHCNSALGMLKDSSEVVRGLAAYRDRWNS